LAFARAAEEATIVRKAVVQQLGQSVIDTANVMSGVIGAGGKILIAGNGGSATMSSHFAAEMVVRLTSARNRQALPAIALSSDIGVLTACANDYGFENVFARQVEALGNRSDMLIVMSTSGNSENLLRAVKVAKEKNLICGALLGGTGGKLAKMVERPLVIPHPSTQRIQEEHLFLIHYLVELVERDLFA
ncbi:MAG: SIS domain-containing protein, partial [candidate division Zixibacteria bacterium]|nr:SIS domain-containing protein [candidate division Zixibacteria bacterium]